ncbi:glycosyltransferase family 39 protein [Patescibacteria group bacterium]|nr:glycosyltransferase family 39 protein [Patescibacteria group bacterium]
MKRIKNKQNNLLKICFFVLLILIILLSLFPRSVDFLNGNPIFGFDQGRDYLVAKQIVIDHRFTLIGAQIGSGSAFIQGIFQGPFYYYFLSLAFFLSGGSPNGAVLLMLILSLTTIIFSFYFGKKLFGTGFGLTAALLVAVSPTFISQARFAWAPYPESIFILLSFYFTFLFSQNNKTKIFLAAFFAGFVYNFEFAVAVPICLGLLIYSVYFFKRNLKAYLALFAGFVTALSPMILFEMRHGFMGLKGFISYLSSHNKSVVSFYPSAQSLIYDHWKSFLYNVSNTFPSGGILPPLAILILLILLTIYFLTKEQNINLKKFIAFLLFLIPIHFFVFYFLKNTVWDYYLTALNFVYILLITYILYSSLCKKSYLISTLLSLFLILLTLLGINNAIKTSLYDYSDYGGTAKVKGKIDAIDYIYKDASGKPFGLFVFSPPIYTYPYDYLVWWYGQKNYHYLPNKDKKGIFYLLIEKDPSKSWTYNGWLQTVIKSGKIAWAKILPSGFIVQKRVENE